jgi:hypothetical protein
MPLEEPHQGRAQNLNNLQVARLLFTSPTRAFTELKQKPVFALPMLLTIIGTMLVTAWYYSRVDIVWFQEQALAAARISAAQQQQVASATIRPILVWGSVIAAPIVLIIVVSISALYFMLAGSLTNVRYSFKHWFAFNWWASSPQIIAYIPSILILALSNTAHKPVSSVLATLSLNELVFHRAMGTTGYSLLSGLGLVQVAAACLTYIGLRAWSGRSVLFCLVMALLPSVLIYGIWALVAFR